MKKITDADFRPARFMVYAIVQPTKKNGLSEQYGARLLGRQDTVDEVRKAIAEDTRARHDTFGGLIDAAGSYGVRYRVFEIEECMERIDLF